MTQAFMTDRSLLESLNGQQYLVVRPVGDVASFYAAEQQALLRVLPDSVMHPHTGHVTLRGFAEPDRVDALRDVLARWAADQPPLHLEVEAVDGFPPPFQILIARLRRSPSLVGAYASLTAVLDTTDFWRIGELPLDDWVFHLSLAYASNLSEADWTRAHQNSRRDLQTVPAETATAVEFVWYRDGVEHSERLPVGGVGV